MIHSLVVLESPGMWFSLKINISFHHLLTHHLPLYLLCHTFQILPQLWNSSSLVLCMKDIVQLILVPFMIPAHERNKFTTQSVKCAFLGYAITQKGYACYDPQSRHIRISRNVVFFEDQYFFPSFIDPPPRPISHQIHMLPNFDPMNIGPYRYPHF